MVSIDDKEIKTALADINEEARKKRTMFVSIKEFSEITGIKQHGLRILARIEGFPAIRIGTKTMILVDEAVKWLRLNSRITSNGQSHLAI